jgi:hypothetical protein
VTSSRAIAAAVVALAVLACAGCSSPGRYWRDRGLDLLDTFEVGVSAGKGFRAEVRYGLGVWGIGRNEGWRARIGQRSFLLREDTATFGLFPFPLNGIMAAVWWLGDDACMWGLALSLGFAHEDETPVWGPTGGALRAPELERSRGVMAAWGDPPGESFPLGAELHLFVGARVRFLPAEFVDFATGFFGLDLLGDDSSAMAGAAEDESPGETPG